MKYEIEVRRIASIFPGKMDAQVVYGGLGRDPASGRLTRFELKPVPRGKPAFVLEVPDLFETVPSAEGKMVSAPLDSAHIVAQLLNAWRGAFFLPEVGPDARPGIMEIVGTVPTQAELAEMSRTQTKLFDYFYNMGERLAVERQPVPDICRLAAEWLKRSATWLSVRTSAACPHCRSQIDPEATVCPHCRRDIVQNAREPEMAGVAPVAPPLRSPSQK